MTAVSHEEKRAERRLAIARRLFRALVAKDPDRSITLCDSRGEVVVRHDPRPEPHSDRERCWQRKEKVPISRGAEPANRDFTMSSDVGRHLSQLQDDLSLAAIPPS